MLEEKLNSWEDFEYKIENLFNKIKEQSDPKYTPYPLFRGQRNSDWKLKTTLERATLEKISCNKYHSILGKIKSHIESISENSWDFPKYQESDNTPIFSKVSYSFMIYLRHHQFPSPLLDWTRSPYVAAFFAFNDFDSEHQKDVAIFTYIEDFGFKVYHEEDAKITKLGPDVKTHKRHYLQQSEYTICTKKEDDDGKVYFWNHEEVFFKNSEFQDLLTKYIIPYSERQKVLKKLDLMNINSYSLFHNEEGLMNTLALREFIINDK